jgi:DNA-binding CsgD family transcriptional regulator/tetratricopeptide (TPR) repeat protein
VQAVELRGRRRECQALDDVLAGVRRGESRALVLRGQAGVGKTALLDHAVNSAHGFAVTRAGGVESEVELPYAALHQLCGRMFDRIERLPSPQADALGVAFGVDVGEPPDRYIVGLATLNLLAEVAADQPLLCVVDDAQWLDQATARTLAFVARRLGAESIAVLFGAREPLGAPDLAGVPELVVRGLSDVDSRALLVSVLPGRVDTGVVDQVVAEARGNPLALLELPRGLTPVDLAGGFPMLRSMSLSGRMEEAFFHRYRALPEQTQLLLLLAAAEPVGDPALLWRAGASLGVGVEDATAAEAEELVQIGTRVLFRHPLVRSAIYNAGSIHERQRVHAALAQATDAADPDRRAWHRAVSSSGPDEDVASDLERSAERALDRGGVGAAGAFLERAAVLTPDPARRAQRALRAAEAHNDAGIPHAALRMLDVAQEVPLDDVQSARLVRLRARVAFVSQRGNDAAALLLDAARRLATIDGALSRETYLEAWLAAAFVGYLDRTHGIVAVAEAALSAPPAPDPPRTIDLLLDALATRYTAGYEAAVPHYKDVIRAFLESRASDDLRWFTLAWSIAGDLWDDDALHALATREVELAREAGALAMLPMALSDLAGVRMHAGDFRAAAALYEEADTITNATGGQAYEDRAAPLAAWRGREPETLHLIDTMRENAQARGERRATLSADHAITVLYVGLGRYDLALLAAQRICDRDETDIAWALPELIEAAARAGDHELATATVDRLAARTRASGTDYALGIEARSRALVTDDAVAADTLYREAITRLAHTRMKTYFARAHLIYGEWLRRQRRVTVARAELRTANEMFIAMGAEGFADRAARELHATGEHVRARRPETSWNLTGQEARVAELAGEGAYNPEIAAQLYISPRTVEYHLHKVFAKLGINSRHQLADALAKSL